MDVKDLRKFTLFSQRKWLEDKIPSCFNGPIITVIEKQEPFPVCAVVWDSMHRKCHNDPSGSQF